MITGAASGIGRAIAERCVSEGMKVVLADIDEANLTKAEAEMKTAGGTVLGVRTDVSGLTAFKAAMEAGMLLAKWLTWSSMQLRRSSSIFILSDPEWTEVIGLRTDSLLRMENPQNPVATIMNRGQVKDAT